MTRNSGNNESNSGPLSMNHQSMTRQPNAGQPMFGFQRMNSYTPQVRNRDRVKVNPHYGSVDPKKREYFLRKRAEASNKDGDASTSSSGSNKPRTGYFNKYSNSVKRTQEKPNGMFKKLNSFNGEAKKSQKRRANLDGDDRGFRSDSDFSIDAEDKCQEVEELFPEGFKNYEYEFGHSQQY